MGYFQVLLGKTNSLHQIAAFYLFVIALSLSSLQKNPWYQSSISVQWGMVFHKLLVLLRIQSERTGKDS